MPQLSLFEDTESFVNEELVSIANASQRMSVSEATIRNWIKEDLLTSTKQGYVTQKSILALKANSNSLKLTSRANKSQKSNHDHESLSQSIKEELAKKTFYESIVERYESALSESYRNKEGIYYTDADIVRDMMQNLFISKDTTFLDPCCGCGNYIVEAVERGVDVDNIYGFDIDENAVAIARRRVFEKTGKEPKHIVCDNFLNVAYSLNRTFDLIYTNPPWGKKISKEEKQQYARLYGAGESIDTCSLFVFASLRLLSKGGSLGFLLPESILNISVFQSAREAILSKQIEEIKDYGTPFDGVQTEVFSLILKNCQPKEENKVKCCFDGKSFDRLQTSFLNNPKCILNIWANEEEQKVIRTLYSVPHKTLENNTKWALGIVTGDNKRLCSTTKKEGMSPIFRGKDITLQGLLKPSLYIGADLSKCQQVAPLEMYYADEKIIYRFISNKLVFYCDKEKRLVLNSANLLVLNKNFQINGEQLASLMNSRIMNWLFDKLFHTHKVLRGDLEQIPIFTNYYVANVFDEEIFIR